MSKGWSELEEEAAINYHKSHVSISSHPDIQYLPHQVIDRVEEGAIRINLTSSPVIAELATVVFPHLWLHDLLYTEYSTPVVVLTIIQSI